MTDNDVDRLIGELTNSDDEVDRRYAAEDLGMVADPKAIPALVNALQDRSRGVQEAAAGALVSLGCIEVCDGVIKLLESENSQLRNLAIGILERLGEPAVGPLLDVCRKDNTDSCKFAVDILGVIGEVSSEPVLECCIGLLESDDVNIASSAAETLGKLEDVNAIPNLINRLHGSHPWLQTHILMALAAIDGETSLNELNQIDPSSLPPVVQKHYETAKAMLEYKVGGSNHAE